MRSFENQGFQNCLLLDHLIQVTCKRQAFRLPNRQALKPCLASNEGVNICAIDYSAGDCLRRISRQTKPSADCTHTGQQQNGATAFGIDKKLYHNENSRSRLQNLTDLFLHSVKYRLKFKNDHRNGRCWCYDTDTVRPGLADALLMAVNKAIDECIMSLNLWTTIRSTAESAGRTLRRRTGHYLLIDQPISF